MATIVRRKNRAVPSPKPQPFEDAFEGDVTALVGHEDELTDDHDLCERVFASKQEAFTAGRQLGWPEEPPEGEATWTPADLYARPVGNRRIMFLELVAWAIARAEAPRSPEEFARFEIELRRARVATGWGHLPWPKAKEPERFARHVTDMANGFTVLDGGYVARLGAD